MIRFEDVKVEITLRNKGKMKALAAIEYQGFRITHFRVMIDKDTGELWVEFPSIRIYSKYQRCVWVLHDDDYLALQDVVLTAYNKHVVEVRDGITPDTTPLSELDLPDTQ